MSRFDVGDESNLNYCYTYVRTDALQIWLCTYMNTFTYCTLQAYDFNRIQIYNHFTSVHPSLYNVQRKEHKLNIYYIHTIIMVYVLLVAVLRMSTHWIVHTISQHICKRYWWPCLDCHWFLGNAHYHGPQSCHTFLSAARSKKQYGLSTTWLLSAYQVPYRTSPTQCCTMRSDIIYTASNNVLRYLHTGAHTQTHAHMHTHTPISTPSTMSHLDNADLLQTTHRLGKLKFFSGESIPCMLAVLGHYFTDLLVSSYVWKPIKKADEHPTHAPAIIMSIRDINKNMQVCLSVCHFQTWRDNLP